MKRFRVPAALRPAALVLALAALMRVTPAEALCSAAPTGSTSDGALKFMNAPAYGIVSGISSTAESVLVYDSTANAFKYCDGTNWQTLSTGTTPAAGTSGYVQFNTSNAFNADSNFFWDNTNKRLGIGVASPSYTLHVAETTTATSGSDYMQYNALTVTPSAASSADTYAGRNYLNFTGTYGTTGFAVAGYNYAIHNGSGTIAYLWGGLNYAYNNSSGTVTTGVASRNIYLNNNASATTTTALGAYNVAEANANAPAITTAYGASNVAMATVNTTTGTLITTAYGASNYTQNAGTGTITNAYGALDRVHNSSTGTITTAYSVRADLVNTTGGTVVNWYGLWIPAVSGPAPTTNRYPIYVGDTGDNYIAGNVGIGTTSPAQMLDVRGGVQIGATTGSASIELGSGATASRYAYIDLVGDTTYTDYGLRLIRGQTGANATNQLIARGTGGLYLITNEAAPIIFQTTASEAMRIDSAGYVGIGTASPSFPIHAYFNGNATLTPFMLKRANTTDRLEIGFQPEGALSSSNVQWNLGIPDSGNNISLSSWDGTTRTYRLIVNVSGNVGIGTTTANATLDVNGYAKLKTNSAAPVACSATYKGSIAYTGTTTNYLCFCDGTSWKQVHSIATACTW